MFEKYCCSSSLDASLDQLKLFSFRWQTYHKLLYLDKSCCKIQISIDFFFEIVLIHPYVVSLSLNLSFYLWSYSSRKILLSKMKSCMPQCILYRIFIYPIFRHPLEMNIHKSSIYRINCTKNLYFICMRHDFAGQCGFCRTKTSIVHIL